MKPVLYSILIGLVLLGIASATSDCQAAVSLPTHEYTKCQLIKPVDTVSGDLVIINCTKLTNVNNLWVASPIRNANVHITGYDEHDKPVEDAYFQMDRGTYSFRPTTAGNYLIQIGAYSASFKVGESQIVDGGLITGAAIAGNSAAPEVEAQQTVDFEGGDSTLPDVAANNRVTPSINSLLNVVMNSADVEKTKRDAPGFILLIVGLLIA